MATHHQAQSFDGIKAITPHDSTDNLKGVLFIQNTGTDGAFTIRQTTGYGNVAAYLKQGDSMMVGRAWRGVMVTSLGAGVTIVGFYA